MRWYLSPSPNFFSDWLWPYCDVKTLLETQKLYALKMAGYYLGPDMYMCLLIAVCQVVILWYCTTTGEYHYTTHFLHYYTTVLSITKWQTITHSAVYFYACIYQNRRYQIRRVKVLVSTERKSRLVAPLICTLKSDFEGATWDFLGHELERI